MVNLNASSSEPVPPTKNSVLVINCGSSSVKFALIGQASDKPLISGLVERLNGPDAVLTWKTDGEKHTQALPGADLVAGLRRII